MRILTMVPALLLLAACEGGGAGLDRPGMWQPSGVNDRNLRAMLADPDHLNEGIGTPRSRSVTAVAPITRMDAGERPDLPEVRSSSVRVR